MARHIVDHRANPGPSRLKQFLRITRRTEPATWHRAEAAPSHTARLLAYLRIARGRSA